SPQSRCAFFATGRSATDPSSSICHREPEARCKALAIGAADTGLCEECLPPGAHDLPYLVDNRSGFFHPQIEDGSPGKGVLDGRIATLRPHSENEPALKTNLGLRNDVVEWRQSPTRPIEKEAMVAQVIIVVRDEDVEHHAAKQLVEILAHLSAKLPDRSRQIGIAVPADLALVRPQNGQTRSERQSFNAVAMGNSIEPLDQVDV